MVVRREALKQLEIARVPVIQSRYETPGAALGGRYDGFLLRIIKLVIHKARAEPPAFVAKRLRARARSDGLGRPSGRCPPIGN
jgi:hypothetical protein